MAYSSPTRQLTPKRDPQLLAANLRSKLVPLAVGLVSFVVTELMHFLLVPDIGRVWERLLAEGLSAVVVALLTAGLIHLANQRREAALLRIQVIADMNHHIRNALAAISLSTDAIQNQQRIQVISESVDRITWALREVLPRTQPLREEDRDRPFYFELSSESGSATNGADQSREETKWIRQA